MGRGGRAPALLEGQASCHWTASPTHRTADAASSARHLPLLRPNHPSPITGASFMILPRNSKPERARDTCNEHAPSLPAAPEDLLEQGSGPGRLWETAQGGAHRLGTHAQACARDCMHAFPAQQRRGHPKQRGAFIAQLRPRHCSVAESTLDGRSSPSTAPQATTEGGSTLQATGGKRGPRLRIRHPGSLCRAPAPSMLFSPLLVPWQPGCLNSGPTAEGVLWTAARGRSSLRTEPPHQAACVAAPSL